MPEYVSKSIYFKDESVVARLEKMAASIPNCNLSKLVNSVMEKVIDELEEKDFVTKRTHAIAVEVTL